jgi:hypothetical protein
MNHRHEFDFGTPAERLNTLTNLVELALYAPEGEVTLAGQAALQRAARQIVLLSGEIIEGTASSPQGANVHANHKNR